MWTLLQFILQRPVHAYYVSRVTPDNARWPQKSIKRRRDFQSVFAVHTDWIVACAECLCSSVYRAFPVFYFLYYCRERDIFSSSIFRLPPKFLYQVLSIIYRTAANEPISFCIILPTMYRNTHSIDVKMYHYTPNIQFTENASAYICELWSVMAIHMQVTMQQR